MQKTAMTKTISGHSTPKSAMAMAIVAIPVTPPLGGLGSFRRQLWPLTRRQKLSRSSTHSHKLSCIQSWLSYLWQNLRVRIQAPKSPLFSLSICFLANTASLSFIDGQQQASNQASNIKNNFVYFAVFPIPLPKNLVTFSNACPKEKLFRTVYLPYIEVAVTLYILSEYPVTGLFLSPI